jgi:hypothetical protein
VPIGVPEAIATGYDYRTLFCFYGAGSKIRGYTEYVLVLISEVAGASLKVVA